MATPSLARSRVHHRALPLSAVFFGCCRYVGLRAPPFSAPILQVQPGAVGMRAIRPLATYAVALLSPLATDAANSSPLQSSLGTANSSPLQSSLARNRFYPCLPQVNRATFTSLLLSKLLDEEVIDD